VNPLGLARRTTATWTHWFSTNVALVNVALYCALPEISRKPEFEPSANWKITVGFVVVLFAALPDPRRNKVDPQFCW
jgi:hypothetical protein